MPKMVKALSALEVGRLKHPGDRPRNVMIPVGEVSGLYLQITPSDARSWVLRTMVGLKRREIGLGGFSKVGLGEAYQLARDAHAAIGRGEDPVETKKADKARLIAEQRRNLTFADAVERFLEQDRMEQFKNDKQAKLWRSTLEKYAVPEIGKLLVEDVDLEAIKRVLSPIWNSKRETATRVRSRVEDVIAWAMDGGHRINTDNPASKAMLKTWIKNQGAAVRGNWPALRVGDLPAWFAALRERDGMAAKALEFLTLTAARQGEARGMLWSEYDAKARVWTVPPSRMKMTREHRVPLSAAAVHLLDTLPRREGVDYVFPAARDGELSDAALSGVMKRLHAAETEAGRAGWIDAHSGKAAVPHGLRSTFKDWSLDQTQYPSDMSEVALAHKVGTSTEQAYRRSDMLERRRAMMDDWAAYCEGKERTSDNVVQLVAVAG